MPQFRLRVALEPIIRIVMHQWWRFARGLTMGVRAVVVDAQGRVFLVKHSYVSGWHLPGGGVEVGETALEALGRELREEGNIELQDIPSVFGVYFNGHVSRRDHVLLYVVRSFVQTSVPAANREIVATGFFGVTDLPADTTQGTRARITEVLQGVVPAAHWRPMDGR
jgi:8-oxo-dGTP pyrophosphatase MutT (NUDIX family)